MKAGPALPWLDSRGRRGEHKLLMRMVLALGIALASGCPVGAGELSLRPNGHIDLNARGVPLGQLLQQFDRLTRLDTTLVDRRAESAAVSVAAVDVPVDVALQAALQAAGVSFVLWGDGSLSLRLLVLGEMGQPAATPSAPSAPPAPVYHDDPAVAAAIQAGIAPDDPDLAMVGTGAPERTLAPEDDPDLAEILGPPPEKTDKPEEGAKKP